MKEKEVKKLLRKNKLKWKDFCEWMGGQTIGMNEDGSIDYYDWDVKRYIELKVKGTPTYFD